MSRWEVPTTPHDLGFPRVSGDEPDSYASVTSSPSFSPRERG